MARDFEDHCWRDVVDDGILEIYQSYRRALRVGDSPALLAIDLYNRAYAGGPGPVREINRKFPAPAATTPGTRSPPRYGCSTWPGPPVSR